MKILAISDTHNLHHEIPLDLINNEDGSIDTIIHAGDMTGSGRKGEVEVFLNWFNKLNYKNKILIAGNHDFFFEQAKKEDIEDILSKYTTVIYLNDSGIEIDGIRFWGSPVQPYFYNWAFNRVGDNICKHWDMIPLDTDILVTHGPILGYLDITNRGDSTGCPYLLETVKKMKNLKSHICGHIHEGYGTYKFADDTIFINASVLNSRYEMQNKPILIQI